LRSFATPSPRISRARCRVMTCSELP